nr:hypothetical protein [uncultured Neokomagataea sp.]
MRLRGSAISLGSACAVALLLSGCAQTPLVQRAVAPNPFGYQKVSAVCHVSPVTTGADGSMAVTMAVRSDDGLCALSVQQPGGGNYASFGVNPAPSHGKAFLYNYDGQTYVDYTPATSFVGSDSFTAELIPVSGGKREHLTVKATVDATGVSVTAPVPPSSTKAAAPVAKKVAPARHVRARHKR